MKKSSSFIHNGAIWILTTTAGCFITWSTWATIELFELREKANLKKEQQLSLEEKLEKIDQRVEKIYDHLIKGE